MHDPAAIFVGNQTAFSATTIFEPFEHALASGFDAFEWFPDKKASGAGWEESDWDAPLRAGIRQAAQARGMRLSLHAPWQLNPVASATTGLRPWLEPELDLAADLGAVVLVLHLYTDAGVPAFAKAVLPAVQRAAARGITIAIENTVQTTPADFNLLFTVLRSLEPTALAHVGMCLDLGHANLCAATRNDYLGFIDQLLPNVPIRHVHLHENWGDADTHLPLFTGPAGRNGAGLRGFVRRMKQRGFSGSLILEQWPQPPTLLNQARQGLLQLWNEERPLTDAIAKPQAAIS